MWFFKILGMGFAFTIGVEFALGLCLAVKAVLKGASQK